MAQRLSQLLDAVVDQEADAPDGMAVTPLISL